MELKIKKIFLKSYILNTENQTEFIIKKPDVFAAGFRIL